MAIDNPPLKQSLWTPPKSNSNEIETFISLVEKDLFQDTSKQVVTLTKIQHCLWQLIILRWSNHYGLLQKVTQMRLKHLYPWLKRTFFRTLVEKGSHRIDRKMKRKRWKISEKMFYLIRTRTRLCSYKTKGIGSLLFYKQTDCEKANEKIEKSSFLK